VSSVSEAPKPIVGVYIRVPGDELDRLRTNGDTLPSFDVTAALADGRGFDLGRAWEPLAVLIDGGVRLPETGPTLGEFALPDTDASAAWSGIEASRVPAVATQLRDTCRRFGALYVVDGEDTDPYMMDTRTGGYRGNRDYLVKKLELLAKHFAEAAERGEAMLVRIGERT
jgi:hypothetical protein